MPMSPRLAFIIGRLTDERYTFLEQEDSRERWREYLDGHSVPLAAGMLIHEWATSGCIIRANGNDIDVRAVFTPEDRKAFAAVGMTYAYADIYRGTFPANEKAL